MQRLRFLSRLRVRLVLLILCALLPVMGILLINASENRRREAAQIESDVRALSQLAASQQEQVIEGARQVLIAVSLIRDVRSSDSEACGSTLAELVEQYEAYTGFSVVNLQGDLICRSVPLAEPINVLGSYSFETALRTKELAAGEFAVGRATGKPTLGLCYPILSNDQPQAVICGGLDLEYLNQRATEFQLPPGSTLTIIDRSGTVLVRYPQSEIEIGENLSNEPIVQAMLSQTEGQAEIVDSDGINRLYAFTQVHSVGDTGMHLAIGIPIELAFAEVNRGLARDLILLGCVALLTLVLGWWGSDVAVLRRIRELVNVTERFQRGEMQARIPGPNTDGEIDQLGQAFNSMAATIEQRETAQRAAEQALREQREWLRITLASIGDAVIATDLNGKITFMNPVAQTLTGWQEAESLGRPLTEVFNIVQAQTRQVAENPVDRVLREGLIVGLANHTCLITRDGRDVPIDDSAAPIRDANEKLTGVVLIFRDITEREHTEDALRVSRDELAAILEGAGDGITAQDRAGKLRYANDAAARLIGYPTAAALLEAPILEVLQKFEIYDETGQLFPFDRLPGRLALQGKASPSVLLRYRIKETGEEHWSVVKATPVFDKSGQVELAVNMFQEVTALKHAELSQRILAEAGQLLSASLDVNERLMNVATVAVPQMADWCAVDVLDEDENIKRVAVYHIDPAKVELAYELQRRYPVDPEATQGVPQVLRTGQSEYYPFISTPELAANAPTEEQRQLILDLQLRSAVIVPLIAHGRTLGALSLVWAESGRRYSRADLAVAEELGRRAGLAVDNARLYDQTQQLNVALEQRIQERTAQLIMTNTQLKSEVGERQQAQRLLEEYQSQLRQLSGHLQAAREEERTRIAREVHDELGQILTALKMDVVWVQRTLNQESPPVIDRLKSMAQLINTTIQQVRRIATELRPGILDDLGLAAAIEWQLNEFKEHTRLNYDSNLNIDESSLNPNSRTALFRVFQETLTNVARHANATSINVSLTQTNDHVILQVKDNGRGITENEVTQSRSLGLMGMRERVQLLNGEFSIHGSPNEGTTIIVSLPLEKRG